MSLGGTGALAAYFQKNPNDFMAQLHTYFADRVNAEELAPLDSSTTPTDTVTPTPTQTPTQHEAITPVPTLIGKPSITGVTGDDEEEIHESVTAKTHEHEETEIDD